MISVFAYLRVSGRGQIHGDGFRRQFIAIRKYCSANNMKIVRIFKERGVSGTKELEDRPALSRLLIALEEDGVKVAVCEKMDRLARDLMVQETIVADMQKHGYTVISTAEPDLCSSDPSRVLIRQIFGAIAQYDRAMTVLRLRGARERKSARGERGTGRHAFGEKPQEAMALDEIRRLSADHSPVNVWRMLNDKGIRTRSGKPWNRSAVAKIVKRITASTTHPPTN